MVNRQRPTKCYNRIVDERFRKLLREFEAEPKNVRSIGRIYLEYQRAGQDPSEFIAERIRAVRLGGKNSALWLQIVSIFGVSPETGLIIQNLMRRKNRAKILGISKSVELNRDKVDELAMERIAQLVGGEVAEPDNPITGDTWFIQRDDIPLDEITIIYYDKIFFLGDPSAVAEICDNCSDDEHGDCEMGLDEDGDCVCCGESGICEECAQDNHQECERGLTDDGATIFCACCNEEIGEIT